MNKLLSTMLIITLLLLSACNGSSGENTNPNNDPLVATNLSVTLLNSEGESQQSFDKNAVITVQVTVSDQFNQAMSGARVDFSTDLGSLSLDSRLTDASGIASIEVNNSEASLGAGTLSVTSSSLSAASNYEFIDNNVATMPPSLTLQMNINGVANNQLKADQQAQILVRLTDNNDQAIENQIVTFSADIGTLTATTALTKENGTATIALTSDGVIGAGVITASLENSSVSQRLNYEIVSADTILDNDVIIGYFDENNQFNEGVIATSITNNTISAGGTIGLAVDVIDSQNNRLSAPTPVTFTSNCVSNSNAIIDETTFTIRGHASATFEDINCAGINGTDDVIIASVTTNGNTKTASTIISIQGEQLGSIEFISAEPDNIVLQGSGGQETSTLTFAVKSSLGNPIPQQEVTFSLDTNVGGISLSRESGLTNSQGLITTQVASGTTPTVVRVTASASLTSDDITSTVQTQSNALSINTGLPVQSSFTLAASSLNPEASTIGEKSTISAWLADNFNNPVPDGTTINFTSEGGSIVSSCNTVDGSCSVEWTSTGALFDDHRSTILATASGHETFFDHNGNNTFDDADGAAIVSQAVSAGFSRHTPLASGFIDMSEAWRDDNENFVKDPEEVIFIDDNYDGKFSDADGKFNGPQCTGNLCDANAKKSTLRKALVIVMSDAYNPSYILSNSDESTVYKSSEGVNTTLPTIADGSSFAFKFQFADSVLQTLPLGSSINVSSEGGTLKGTTSYEVGNTRSSGYKSIEFTIENITGNDPETGRLIITIKTPNTLNNIVVNKEISLP